MRRERAADSQTMLPLLVVADRQMAGRGRGDHRWWTGEGNLAFSLVVESPFQGRHDRMPLVLLGSAVAVVEALQARLGPIHAGLHWPNDEIAAGRKLAGILVHTTAGQRLVIGIGINIASRLEDAPAEVQSRAATLADLTGSPHDRWAVLVDVLEALNRMLTTLAADPDVIGSAAHGHRLQVGRNLSVKTGTQTVTGLCRGITADGGLVLETATGEKILDRGHSPTWDRLPAVIRHAIPRSVESMFVAHVGQRFDTSRGIVAPPAAWCSATNSPISVSGMPREPSASMRRASSGGTARISSKSSPSESGHDHLPRRPSPCRVANSSADGWIGTAGRSTTAPTPLSSSK